MKKIIFYSMIFLVLRTGANAGMVDTFMDACEGGNMQGCYQAGVVYWTGEGAGKNIEVARSLLEISCDGGFDDACVALRTIDEQSKETSRVQQDMQVSSSVGSSDADVLAADIRAYKNNCIKGDMASCYQVGTTYDGTNGVKYNLNLAKQFFDLSCEGGYHRACGDLAAVYMKEKFRDYKKAQYFAKIACDKEKENGCLVLGRMYNNNDYLTKNQVLAKQYFSKALKYSLKNCSQSIGSACDDAAWLYDTDVLGVKDKEKAKQFYAKACRLDSLDGCLSMAAIYESSRDMKKAVELYRKVCERYGGMCGYLATLYQYGDGNLKKDPVLAKKYYRKACELGDEAACKEITH